LREIEASQQKEPNRFRGFYLAARAAELAGDTGRARASYERLVTLAREADSPRPEIVQAKAFLGTR
jgi:hypothetical protein